MTAGACDPHADEATCEVTSGTAEPEIDTSVPHSARIWNYWLGGKDNYPVDREAGDAYMAQYPGIVGIARAQRLFLQRAVRYLAGQGVRQFLDLGTGLPTVDNTHEVAQRVAPDARVVYVDNDPLVLTYARALLISTPQGATDYIEADVGDPDAIVDRAAATLDFARPVAVMLLGILGHIPDTGDALDIVRRLVAHLVPGSYVAICDGVSATPARAGAQAGYNATGAAPYRLRPLGEITGFFDGLDLVEPGAGGTGVVAPDRWHPEHLDALADGVEARAGIGRVS